MIIQLTMCVNVKWVFTKVMRICFMLLGGTDEGKKKMNLYMSGKKALSLLPFKS